jgi:hypothetical protein
MMKYPYRDQRSRTRAVLLSGGPHVSVTVQSELTEYVPGNSTGQYCQELL